MFRKTAKPEGHESEREGGHDSRPWVFFMVDCFMLITEFFVLTFQFKTEEVILPHQMPPGGHHPTTTPIDLQSLTVHVLRVNDIPMYEIMREKVNEAKLAEALATTAQQHRNVIVRVSYEPGVPWNDVITVFNECSRAHIEKCGLIQLHNGSERAR